MPVKGRMPHAFIPTLATLNAARGLALMLSDGAPQPGMPKIVQTAGAVELGPIPVPVIIVAGFALLAWVLANRLQWGRRVYLVGADKEAARRLGIPVDAVFCANDQMALGAIQAIAAHKLTKKIKLIGFDGALEATQHILEGDMQATIAQDPYGMAKVGVEEAIAKLKGRPVKRNVNTGAKLITPGNARGYFQEVRGKLGNTGRGLDG
jgi:hypothetical protein